MNEEQREFMIKGIKRNLDADFAYNEIPHLTAFDEGPYHRYFLRAVEIGADGEAHVRDIGEVKTVYSSLFEDIPHIETDVSLRDGILTAQTKFSGDYVKESQIDTLFTHYDKIQKNLDIDMFDVVVEEMTDLQARIDYLNPHREPDGEASSILCDGSNNFKAFLGECIEGHRSVGLD